MGKYILINYDRTMYIISPDKVVHKFWDDRGDLYFHKTEYKYDMDKFPGYEFIGTYDMPLTLITDYLAKKMCTYLKTTKYNLHFMCPTHDCINNYFNGSFRLEASIDKKNKKDIIINVKNVDLIHG